MSSSSTKSSGKPSRSAAPVRRQGNTPYLDIPPRIRNVLIVVALAGMICAVIGSLMAKKGVAVEADKIVHFAGYTLLGALMIMGLRPILWPLGILLVAGMSAGLELIQPIFGRSCDFSGDFTTNCMAVATGAGVGMLGRFIWSYIQTEMVNAGIRKATVGFGDGQVIFRQGEASDKFYIVRSGQVVLTKEAGGSSSELARVGPGEVIGEMGVIQNLPRTATATAKGRCLLYGMTAQDLLDKRSDGQDHPGSIVSRVLAARLRKANEKLEKLELGTGSAQEPQRAQGSGTATANTVSSASKGGAKILLRMGWRVGDQVTWGEQVSEHQLPLVFGRNPGPAGVLAGTEVVLLEEQPPQWLSPMQFRIESQSGGIFMRDEQSERGNEVSGVGIGPIYGVNQVQLPAGTHVLVAGGEGSPYVMALEIPSTV